MEALHVPAAGGGPSPLAVGHRITASARGTTA
eukprot:CAMPEP_0170318554 /NCGR_PEP_ID=MMETSP0116_2-20130129/59975_1 /TAXON_ID=400756 /ORGANISM="Durinskia baltica, Strain CSIRO CS-38" /LENGTH=31 /DNA_ID= /DNA_START= /DNA_END= /DNA_ORIENTATION=